MYIPQNRSCRVTKLRLGTTEIRRSGDRIRITLFSLFLRFFVHLHVCRSTLDPNLDPGYWWSSNITGFFQCFDQMQFFHPLGTLLEISGELFSKFQCKICVTISVSLQTPVKRFSRRCPYIKYKKANSVIPYAQ